MDQFVQDIGLVFWGCKGGYKPCLFSNKVVDVNDEDIAETVKDIRKYVRFLRPYIDYYALEFTPKYKVFTIYRSSYDSGDGAFVAITIYVPHKEKFNKVRSVLLEMMDFYFKEYIDVLGGYHLQGKYYDISLFQSILNNHAEDIVPETMRYKTVRSVRNNIPQLLIYDNVEEVDFYFGSPYREIFQKSQEVTMVSRDSISSSLNNSSSRGGRNDALPQIDESLHIIEKSEIGDQRPASMLLPYSNAEISLDKLVIEGSDVTEQIKTKECVLLEGQTIEIVLSKAYCETLSRKFTTEKALSEGILKRDGENFRISNHIDLNPVEVKVSVSWNKSVIDITLLQQLLVAKDQRGNKFSSGIEKDGLYWVFQGSAIDQEYEVLLFLFKGATHSETVTKFIPSQCSNVELDITNVEFSISKKSVDYNGIEKVVVYGKNADGTNKFNVKYTIKRLDLAPFYLPTSIADTINYEFDIAGYKCIDFDRRNLQITVEPTHRFVFLDTGDLRNVLVELNKKKNLPKSALSLSKGEFWFDIDGVKYSTHYDEDSKRLYLNLPFHYEDMELGKMYQSSGLNVDYDLPKKKDDVIYLKGSIIVNTTKETIDVLLRNNEDNTEQTITIASRSFQIIPKECDPVETESLHIPQIDKEKDSFIYYELQPIVSGNVERDEVPATIVFLHGCENLYFKDGNSGRFVTIEHLKKDFYDKGLKCIALGPKKRTEYSIYDSDGSVLCSILFPESIYNQNQDKKTFNIEHGFRIQWEKGNCHIYYEPELVDKISSIKKKIRRNLGKIFLIPIILLICLFSGYGIYTFLNKTEVVPPFRVVFHDSENQTMQIKSLSGGPVYIAKNGDTLIVRNDSVINLPENKIIVVFNDDDTVYVVKELQKYSATITDHFNHTKILKKPLIIKVTKKSASSDTAGKDKDVGSEDVSEGGTDAGTEDTEGDNSENDFQKMKNDFTTMVGKINNKSQCDENMGQCQQILNNFSSTHTGAKTEEIRKRKEFCTKYKELFSLDANGFAEIEGFNAKYKKYLTPDQRKKFANTYACNEPIFKLLVSMYGMDLNKAWDFRCKDEKHPTVQWPKLK